MSLVGLNMARAKADYGFGRDGYCLDVCGHNGMDGMPVWLGRVG